MRVPEALAAVHVVGGDQRDLQQVLAEVEGHRLQVVDDADVDVDGSDPGLWKKVTSSELSLHWEFLCSIVLITFTICKTDSKTQFNR